METSIYEVTVIRCATYEVVATSPDAALDAVVDGRAVLVDEQTLKMTAEVQDEDQDK